MELALGRQRWAWSSCALIAHSCKRLPLLKLLDPPVDIIDRSVIYPMWRPFCFLCNPNNNVLSTLLIIPILIHVKMFIPRQVIHGCRYCSKTITNELRLLVSMCFWVEKGIYGRTNQFKKHCIRTRTSVFVSSSQPLHHTDDWIASFYIALFKSHNYGNYVRVFTLFISR